MAKPKINFSNNSELSREEVQALAPTPMLRVVKHRSAPATPLKPIVFDDRMLAIPMPTKEVTVEEIMPKLSEEEQERLTILNELALAKAKKEQAQAKPPVPPTPAPEPEPEPEDDDFDDEEDGSIDDDDWDAEDDNEDLFDDGPDDDDFDFQDDADLSDDANLDPLLKATTAAVADAETTADLVYQTYGDSAQHAAVLRFVEAMSAVNLAVRDFVAAHHKE